MVCFLEKLNFTFFYKKSPNIETFDLSTLYTLEFSMKMKKHILKINNSQRIALKMIEIVTSLNRVVGHQLTC